MRLQLKNIPMSGKWESFHSYPQKKEGQAATAG